MLHTECTAAAYRIPYFSLGDLLAAADNFTIERISFDKRMPLGIVHRSCFAGCGAARYKVRFFFEAGGKAPECKRCNIFRDCRSRSKTRRLNARCMNQVGYLFGHFNDKVFLPCRGADTAIIRDDITPRKRFIHRHLLKQGSFIFGVGTVVFTVIYLMRSRPDKDIPFYTGDNAAAF